MSSSPDSFSVSPTLLLSFSTVLAKILPKVSFVTLGIHLSGETLEYLLMKRP